MKDRIYFKGRDFHERIFVKEILWVEGDGSSSIVVTSSRKISISMNLKNMLHRLQLNEIIRVHKSYAVNVTHIIALNHKSLILQVATGKKQVIPVSQGYRSKVLNLINIF